MQQDTYWTNQGRHTCPIKLFDEDLKTLVKDRFQAGDHVTVGIDANEDVRGGSIKTMMDSLGMRKAVIHLHPTADSVETCNKNTRRVPIDGIFVSGGIEPSSGGHTSHDTVVSSDHRSLWLDIPYTSTLSFKPPKRPPPKPRRLNGKDPRSGDAEADFDAPLMKH